MKKILVIGASGFVGRHLTNALSAQGYTVRCLTRNPAQMPQTATHPCELVRGDISDPASIQQALQSMDAVYVSMHTVSPQQAGTTQQGFMDIEKQGIRTIVEACRSTAIRRIVYITSIGISPSQPSEWVRGRWEVEQLLLNSGLDVTILRPGLIVGAGGTGFALMAAQAKGRVAITMGSGKQNLRSIAIDDLVYYLTGVLNEVRTYGQAFDVGGDDVFTYNQMIDIMAGVVGSRPPIKIHLPTALLIPLAPLMERARHLPKGAVRGFLESLKTDMVGNPIPIRTLLPRSLLTYREAIEKALRATQP